MKKIFISIVLISTISFPIVSNAALFFACHPGMDCSATTTPGQSGTIVIPTNTTLSTQQIASTTEQVIATVPTSQPTTITQDNSAQIQALQTQLIQLLQQLIALLNLKASLATIK